MITTAISSIASRAAMASVPAPEGDAEGEPAGHRGEGRLAALARDQLGPEGPGAGERLALERRRAARGGNGGPHRAPREVNGAGVDVGDGRHPRSEERRV